MAGGCFEEKNKDNTGHSLRKKQEMGQAWLRGDVGPVLGHRCGQRGFSFSEQLSSVYLGNRHTLGLLTSLNFPEYMVLTQEQPAQSAIVSCAFVYIPGSCCPGVKLGKGADDGSSGESGSQRWNRKG